MAVADSKIRQLLQPIVEALGCELWGIDLQSGAKTKLLRVFIDKDNDLIGIEAVSYTHLTLPTTEIV